MKVLLISVQWSIDVTGLKYLHHYLLDHGHESVLLFLPEFYPDDERALRNLDAFVNEAAPGLIGVSLMSIEYQDACEVTGHLKEAFPDIPIVWGGIHATIAPEMCADQADYVCVGEGEQTILRMADALQNGESLDEIPNLCRRQDGEIKWNPPYPLIEDLDALPLLKQIPPNSFVQSGGHVRPVDRRALRRHMRYGTTVYNVMSSRGCPFACAYCCNNFLRKMYPNWRVRRRSVAHVIAELEQAVADFPGIEYVNLYDDCFLACDMDYLHEFCHAYQARIHRGIIAKSTPTYVTDERIALLKLSGLHWFNLGMQSGSDRVCKDIYNRRSLPRHFLDAARVIHKHGVALWYDVIVDNPFETDEDRLQTVEALIATPKPSYPQLFSLVFYYRTDLYQRMLLECPDRINDFTKKDFYVYQRTPANDLIEVAAILPASWASRLLARYRRDPEGRATRAALGALKLLCRVVLRPVTYLRVIRISQDGSLLKTLRVLPRYFRVGFSVYAGLFRQDSEPE